MDTKNSPGFVDTTTMARSNAEAAFDQRHDYPNLRALWGAYRDNVEDTAEEMGADREGYLAAYEAYDRRFLELTGYDANADDACPECGAEKGPEMRSAGYCEVCVSAEDLRDWAADDACDRARDLRDGF